MAKIKEYVNVDGTPLEWTEKKEYDKNLYPEVYVSQLPTPIYEDVMIDDEGIMGDIYTCICSKGGELYELFSQYDVEEIKTFKFYKNDDKLTCYDVYHSPDPAYGGSVYQCELASSDAGDNLAVAKDFSGSEGLFNIGDKITIYK